MLYKLRTFEKLMQDMASRESIPAQEPLERLRSLSSRIISLFTCADAEGSPGAKGGDGFSLLPEEICCAVGHEALHYRSLVEEAATRACDCGGIPESVKRIHLALIEDVRSGYEHYLAAYSELEEALCTGDISHCSLAEAWGEQGADLIRTASEVIEEIRSQVPVIF
ncbi:MAG: hypothetical protein RDV48_21700 [Candidatus Eremiobacteraeota bacterium]|nr:hypothetical protein [Candidatus Eremiobacteraeota bacterium]